MIGICYRHFFSSLSFQFLCCFGDINEILHFYVVKFFMFSLSFPLLTLNLKKESLFQRLCDYSIIILIKVLLNLLYDIIPYSTIVDDQKNFVNSFCWKKKRSLQSCFWGCHWLKPRALGLSLCNSEPQFPLTVRLLKWFLRLKMSGRRRNGVSIMMLTVNL